MAEISETVGSYEWQVVPGENGTWQVIRLASMGDIFVHYGEGAV